jgi:hypothetical protein
VLSQGQLARSGAKGASERRFIGDAPDRVGQLLGRPLGDKQTRLAVDNELRHTRYRRRDRGDGANGRVDNAHREPVAIFV